MYKNPELESELSQSIMMIDKFDAHTIESIRKDLHSKLDFMNRNTHRKDGTNNEHASKDSIYE